MSLPPEVLARLGDDATPEDAIKAANRGTATYVDNLKQPDGDDNDARFAWYGMLAAAAIRLAEADITYRMMLLATHEFGIGAELDEPRQSGRDLMDARRAYDALCNWRRP